MKKEKYFTSSLNTKEMIKQRMLLQTTQSQLKVEFGVERPSLEYLTNIDFINKYKTWEEGKKHKFLTTLGGMLNYEKTKRYFEQFVKKV